MSAHGTTARYYAGCRCDECREAKRIRVAGNRARALANGALNHGVRAAYDCGCRCARCRAAKQVDYIKNPGEYQPKTGKRRLVPVDPMGAES